MKQSFFIPLLLLFSFEIVAQNPASQKFRYITPEEGLSQSTVKAILQDSEGFMWFGTQEGLNKYDGQNMVVYKEDDTVDNALSYNEIKLLIEDSHQNIWIGTEGGGISIYNRDLDNFTNFIAPDVFQPHSGKLSENTVQAIIEDSRGNIWIGTYNGLNLFDQETQTFTHFFHDENDPNSLSDNVIVDILEDSQGLLWIVTNSSFDLLNIDEGTIHRFSQDKRVSFSTSYVDNIYEDSKGTLWAGTEMGLEYIDTNSGKLIEPEFPGKEGKILNSISILSIKEDSRGILWIGTENEGLLGIDDELEKIYHFKYDVNYQYGLNNNSIYSLYESQDNLLWIGTYNGGVNILDRKKYDFQHFNQIPGDAYSLSNNSILTFLEDEKNNIWIGTDGGGINRFDQGKEQFFSLMHHPSNKNSLPSNVVLDMFLGSDQKIWMATYRGGVSAYDRENGTFKNYQTDESNPNSLSQNEVFAVYEDREGIIWAGTNGRGLNKLIDKEKGIFRRYTNRDDELPNDFIRDIFEDSQGRFWIGTYGRGVVLMDREKETFKDYNQYNENLSSNVILHIYEDISGKVWVGTKGGGVAYYNAESDSFISYTQQDGLANNVVNGILEDDHGNLWLGTNEGISKFNPTNLEVKNYGLADGLQSREFKPGSAFKDENGVMYFGGVNGFNRFHPDSIDDHLKVPPVVLTDFQIFNESISIGKSEPLQKHINQVESIELPYSASVLTFKYAALDYSSGNGITYAYKLDGFDSDWSYVENQNTATYTNLDPGEYTFKVKVSNTDGVWGDESTQVKLSITPPYWRTAWFYTLSGFVFLSFIMGGFKYRTRQITELNRRLEQDVAKRTSELEDSNRNLKQALKDLEETKEELVANAHKAGMADIATGVLHNIGNVLNSITTSTAITGEVLKKSKLDKLFKANALLRENQNNLEEFLVKDPKGIKLVQYYLKLDDAMKAELDALKTHNDRLEQKVQLINNVIAAQQSYASVGIYEEGAELDKVIKDTLTIFSASLEKHGISLKKQIESTDRVKIQKTKFVHVLLNLLKNAKESILDSGNIQKQISIKLFQENSRIILEIADTGKGIKEEYLDKIFSHGFTTKTGGHGFGLHSSANYLSEMGGDIEVKSNGNNKGALFTICLPAYSGQTEEEVMNLNSLG